MNKKIAVYFMFCFCLFCEGIFAQVKENDSTTSIYQDIHDLSKKSKFNKFVYKLLFRSSALKAENLIPDRKPIKTKIYNPACPIKGERESTKILPISPLS